MTHVLLFGRLRDVAGWREQTLDPPAASLSALRAWISERFPELAAALDGPGIQAAVDRQLVIGDVALTSGSEVAFLSPMSGG
jgi:molybdopterin synthase sulfur carrier subunit